MTVLPYHPYSGLKECTSGSITVKQVQLGNEEQNSVYSENVSNRGVIADFVVQISKKTCFEGCYID